MSIEISMGVVSAAMFPNAAVWVDGVAGVVPSRLAAFAGAAFGLIIVPGPSVLFVVSSAMSFGRRSAIAASLGDAAGCWVQATAVAIGIGPAVERSARVFALVRLAGAVYLLVLGIKAIVTRPPKGAGQLTLSTPAATGDALDLRRPSFRRRVRDGFVVGAMNPKGLLLFSAVLPQFVDRSIGSVVVQLELLGFLASLMALASDAAWAVAAGTARQWLTRSRRLERTAVMSGGVVMVAMGARLAVDRNVR